MKIIFHTKGLAKYIKFIQAISLILLIPASIFSQNSLYLVDTLTGTPDNRLQKAIGIGDMNGDGYADFVE
jgi:hypothetical protein